MRTERLVRRKIWWTYFSRRGLNLTHKWDIGKQRRPRSDAADRAVWSGSTLFALSTGISVNHGKNKKKLSRPVQRVKVEESTRHQWINMNFYAFQGPHKILWAALCCHVYHFPRTTAGIRYLSIAGLSSEAVNVPLVRGSSVAFNNSSTSISFHKSLVYAKRWPSFLWKLIHDYNNFEQCFFFQS